VGTVIAEEGQFTQKVERLRRVLAAILVERKQLKRHVDIVASCFFEQPDGTPMRGLTRLKSRLIWQTTVEKLFGKCSTAAK
jgi:hypothetical protein